MLLYGGADIREPRKCRERWKNFIDPTRRIGKWTIEEDLTVLEM